VKRAALRLFFLEKIMQSSLFTDEMKKFLFFVKKRKILW